MQPTAVLHAAFEAVATSFVRVPLWVLLALPKSKRPRPSWSLKRTVMLSLLKYLFSAPMLSLISRVAKDPDYLALEQGSGLKGVWVPAVPNAIVGEIKQWAEMVGVESIRIPAYWLEKTGADLPINARPEPGEKVLLVLHGGAYAALSAHPGNMAANIPLGILEHAGPSVRRAFMVEYRLSKAPSQQPSHPFPAALLDAIAGYKYLVEEVGFAPEDIIIEGDSAGGNLSLALIRYLIENQGTEGIPPAPGALILLSPWVDLGPEPADPQSSIYTNDASDFVGPLVRSDGSNVLNFLGPHGKEAAVTNRYISPASLAPTMAPVSFEGYPRTFILGAEAEVFRDQIHIVRDKMQASSGSKIMYVETPEAWHDFLLFPNFEPERTEVLKMIGDWIGE